MKLEQKQKKEEVKEKEEVLNWAMYYIQRYVNI